MGEVCGRGRVGVGGICVWEGTCGGLMWGTRVAETGVGDVHVWGYVCVCKRHACVRNVCRVTYVCLRVSLWENCVGDVCVGGRVCGGNMCVCGEDVHVWGRMCI